MIPHLLDNPAWSALTTAQAAFAVGNDRARRYRKGVLPFAALAGDGGAGRTGDGRVADVDVLIDAGESFYLIGELPELPANWVLESGLPCAQLIGPDDAGALAGGENADALAAGGGEELVALGEADKMEMFELINSVQPGYYLPDTRQLGTYFGIRKAGRLVAMAGERMRLTEFSEISAVCTLPEFAGRGYAQQLMVQLMRRQVAEGIRPFLHVSLANERALRLYEHLGFRHRRDISFWRVRKVGGG